jgi:hypothetical protein
MKRAIALLTLLSAIGCASSNDGFISDDVKQCGPDSPLMIEAGWDSQGIGNGDRGAESVTMLVRVSNNSNEDVTVKFVRVDPMSLDRDTAYELQGGARDFNKLIAQGGDATFDIPMISRRRMQNPIGGFRVPGTDVAVSVVLESKETYRCQFRVPLG